MDQTLTHKSGPGLLPFEGPTTRSRKRRLSHQQHALEVDEPAPRKKVGRGRGVPYAA